MKRTSNFKFKIGMALVTFAAMNLYGVGEGQDRVLTAKQRFEAAKNRASTCGQEVFAKLVDLDLDHQANDMDARTEKVTRIMERFEQQIQAMSSRDMDPETQHAGFSSLLDEIEQVPNFSMLEKTMNKMGDATKRVNDVSERISEVMKKLGVATSKAHEEGATNKVSKVTAMAINWVRRRGNETLADIFEELRTELRTLIDEAGDASRDHWEDVHIMKTMAEDHLRKAEDLKLTVAALERFREGIEKNRREVMGDSAATAKLNQIDLIDNMIDSLAKALNMHQVMGIKMLGSANNGHAASAVLKESQLTAHMAVALQMPILAAETSNAVVLKIADGMMKVAEKLEEAVTAIQNGNGANFKKMAKGIVKQQRRLFSGEYRVTKGEKDFAEGLRDLDSAESDRRKNRMANIDKNDLIIAKRFESLKGRENKAKGNVWAAKLMQDSEFANVVAEEIKAGKITSDKATEELDQAVNNIDAQLQRAKEAEAMMTADANE